MQLHLKSNQIRDTDAIHISTIKKITDLDLSENEIGDVGADHICEMKGITILNLSDNHIRKNNAFTFKCASEHCIWCNKQIVDIEADDVPNMNAITTLILSNNQIGNIRASHLAQMLGIKKLYLQSNPSVV